MTNTTKLPRVLHILEATLGGTLRFVEDVMECSAGMPFKMALAYSTRRANSGLVPALAKAVSAGWETFPLEMSRAVNPLSDAKSILSLRRCLQDYKPNLIHCHSSKAGGIGRLALFGMRKRPKVVYTPNALAIHLGRKYEFAEKALSSWTDRFAAVSEGEREEIMSSEIATSQKIQVVSPGINTQYFAPQEVSIARRKLKLSAENPVIVGVGRMADQKDPLGFVQIAHRLLQPFPGLKAFWVGDGELRNEVEKTIARLGMTGRIIVTGWQNEIRPYLAAADLLLSTSRYESFGYMVAEALAMERAVVATEVNGTTDIMKDGLRAFLYTPKNYDGGANLCSQILLNPRLAQNLGRVGREVITKNFSYSQMRSSLQECYECVLD